MPEELLRSVDPKRHAVWTLGDLYSYLMTWAYDVYDTTPHPALEMSPREAFRRGMERSGERIHCSIDYDETFRFFSLPTTAKGTAKVEPGRGVKVNHLYYWSEEFRPATIEHTQLPIRYDPFNIGIAHAFVGGHWVQCISEYYLQFKGRSERELLLATAELRKQMRNHDKDVSITGKRLAEFLASAEAHEALLIQRLQDVLAQMGGYPGAVPKEQKKRFDGADPAKSPAPQQEQGEKETDVYAGLEIYEEYQ